MTAENRVLVVPLLSPERDREQFRGQPFIGNGYAHGDEVALKT